MSQAPTLNLTGCTRCHVTGLVLFRAADMRKYCAACLRRLDDDDAEVQRSNTLLPRPPNDDAALVLPAFDDPAPARAPEPETFAGGGGGYSGSGASSSYDSGSSGGSSSDSASSDSGSSD